MKIQYFLSSSTLCRIATFAFIACSASLVGCGGGDQGNSESSSKSVAVSEAGTQVDSTQDAGNSQEAATSSAADSIPVNATSVVNRPENGAASGANQVQSDFNLTGVWYGQAVLDLDAANAKLATIPAEDAARLQQIINAFSSIVIAAEFRPDTVMELDMMITAPDGQALRDRSVGTWKILEADDKLMKVQTSEYSGEETEAKEKLYLYRFVNQNAFQFVPDSISPELYTFSPRIVFQRVEQPLDDSDLANVPAETENR